MQVGGHGQGRASSPRLGRLSCRGRADSMATGRLETEEPCEQVVVRAWFTAVPVGWGPDLEAVES